MQSLDTSVPSAALQALQANSSSTSPLVQASLVCLAGWTPWLVQGNRASSTCSLWPVHQPSVLVCSRTWGR